MKKNLDKLNQKKIDAHNDEIKASLDESEYWSESWQNYDYYKVLRGFVKNYDEDKSFDLFSEERVEFNARKGMVFLFCRSYVRFYTGLYYAI